MNPLFRSESVPYELEGYTLKSFAQIDVADTPFVVSYSIYPKEFKKPTPIGFIIIEPKEYAVFTYYDRYSDTWIAEDKCTLDRSVHTVPSQLSYLEDSIVLYGTDCDPIIDVYKKMCETLESKYGVESIEPIEIAKGVEEEIEVERCDSCTTEEFEYHRSEDNNDITLYICQKCHNVSYIEFAGLKYTQNKLTLELLAENVSVNTHTISETMSFIYPDKSPSFFDIYVADIWWKAFKQSGGLEKYAPDLERSVLFVKNDSIVGFIAWNSLKQLDTPVVQNAYFIPEISDEEIQQYYTSFMEEFRFEKLLIHRSIQDIPSNPSNFSVETEPIIVINPSIVTDRNDSIESIV